MKGSETLFARCREHPPWHSVQRHSTSLAERRNATEGVPYSCFAFVMAFSIAAVSFADELHWSFRPIERPTLPQVTKVSWPRNAIDAFILARLEKEGIAPSPEADRRTLIRRVSLDLAGLPPTPEEVAAFLSDDRPDAYERVVDRLLASPRYGERFARIWLDLCHYGDSDGHLTDQLRPFAWRYRDWVCQSLNVNMPFDEFTMAQLAGDIVEEGAVGNALRGVPEKSAGQDTAERHGGRSLQMVLGTGFLRQTLSNREGGADLEEYRVEQVVDRTSLVGAVWLGLTVGCARCHDHKYDPLTQAEFYRLYAFFDGADEVNIDAPLPAEADVYQTARPAYEQRRRELVDPFRKGLKELQREWEKKLLHAVNHPGENHVWDRQWELLGLIWGGGLGEGQLEGTEIVKRPWDKRTAREQDDLLDYFLQQGAVTDEKQFAALKLADLREQLVKLKREHPAAQCARAPVMRTALTPRQTYLHERGEFRSRGENVKPGTPAWLPKIDSLTRSGIRQNSAGAANSATRLALARWLVSEENPLTARVTVNRMWQEFFGRGLVATQDDFGIRGDRPTHPDLLDWLAAEFRADWDVKRLHRLIVTSAAYRQSSRPRPELAVKDPGNALVSRQNSLRVPAETVRDSALLVSGLLSERLGGPSVFPPQPERVTMEAFGNNAWKESAGGDRYRRGLYTFVQRTSPFAQAITFDAPSPQKMCTRRDRSNTPLQALTLLNDPVFFTFAGALAERVLRESGPTDAERIQLAARLCLSRTATSAELDRLTRHLKGLRATTSESGQPLHETEIWTDIASVLLNLHEFINRD